MAARDPSELGRRPGGDHDPLAASRDDCGAGVGKGPALGDDGGRVIGIGRAELRYGLARQGAAVDEQAIRQRQAHVRRDDLAATQQDDVPRHEVGREDVVGPSVAADAGRRSRGGPEGFHGLLGPVGRDDVGPDDRQQPHEHERAITRLAEEDG